MAADINFQNLSSKGPASTQPSFNKAKSKNGMDFTEDPFRDYRYEDPFNLEDPFADVTDTNKNIREKKDAYNFMDAFNTTDMKDSFQNRSDSSNNNFAAFDTDDFFSKSGSKSNTRINNDNVNGGRQSVPLPTNDPFSKNGRTSAPIHHNTSNWSTWGNSSGSTAWELHDENWATGNDNTGNISSTSNVKSQAKNSNKSKIYEMWGKTESSKSGEKSSIKKEKSPKSGYAKTLSVPWGNKSKNKSSNNNNLTLSSNAGIPSEEQQLAWAIAESKKLEEENKEKHEQYEREIREKLAVTRSIKNQ